MTLFVTGGSRGIGAALVRDAARAGWDVAFTYLKHREEAERVADEARQGGRKVAAYALDVRDSACVDTVVDQVLADFGEVRAVVCNAGVSLNGLAYGLTDEDWKAVIDTNLTGSYFVCRAFLPALVAQRFGRIVLVSSVTWQGASGQAAYAASKAGLHGLGGALAKEYGPKGVTTNVVVPGTFDTDMTREELSKQLAAYALQYCPLRRMGSLRELTATILFLCSPEAGYVNGATLPVSGGLDWVP
ncbi:MAG: SDR family oxidoreductase [Deltaproteobacteria bacterium]|nr:SDR family oxidoreductase [Deltaproteobacteria bacterium]